MPNHRPLSGQTALVTGAAKRLGRATALALAENGANVVVHYNTSVSDAEEVADEIREIGVQSWVLSADLADPSEAEALFRNALEISGPIDVLINNASIFPKDTIHDLSPEMLSMNTNINALAPFLLTRAFAAQDRPGSVVNFLDTRIQDYDADHISYHLSKRMLFSITRMMSLQFAPKMRVNAIAPGLILPPEGEDDSYLEKLTSSNPLDRHGDESDIIRAVLYLLSSPFVTGQVMYVDGGRHMRGGAYG